MNVGLESSEEVTLLKFNLYKNSYLEQLNNQSVLNQQFHKAAQNYKNGGKS